MRELQEQIERCTRSETTLQDLYAWLAEQDAAVSGESDHQRDDLAARVWDVLHGVYSEAVDEGVARQQLVRLASPSVDWKRQPDRGPVVATTIDWIHTEATDSRTHAADTVLTGR